MNLTAATGRWATTRTAGATLGLRSPDFGRYGCALWTTLRHPYVDWRAWYSHHERRYTMSEVMLVRTLIHQAHKAGAETRLGDPRWLESAVVRLAPLRARTHRSAWEAVAEVVGPAGEG
ncbi:hypothetical protein ACWC5C_33200 [Streptomyces sp. NPDC001700]